MYALCYVLLLDDISMYIISKIMPIMRGCFCNSIYIRACSFHFLSTGFDHIQWVFVPSGFFAEQFFFYWFFLSLSI